MILEKLSNKMNPKKNIYTLTSKLEKDKMARKNWKHEDGGRRKGRRGRRGKKRMAEENLSESDSQDGGRIDMRARKEMS